MRHSFLVTLCTVTTVVGVTGAAVRADISIDTATDGNKQTQVDRNSKSTPPSVPAPALSSLELDTYRLVNKYRQSRNLPPLEIDLTISKIAKANSERMGRNGRISHDGFSERADSVSQTIVYRKVAENIGYNVGYKNPDLIAIEDWIGSPGHQRNMLGSYDVTGIGVSRNNRGEYYFTQIFIRKAWYVKDAD